MTCGSMRNQLSAHLDGRLPAAAARRIEAHLKECAGCRADLDGLRALKTMLLRAPQPAAPPGFWEGVHAGLHEQAIRRQQRTERGWLVWAWGRAPVLAAGVAGLLLVAAIPVQYLEQSRTPLSVDDLVARHAGYCARQPLLEHGRLHFLAAEARDAEAE